jgi:hypothetical protein
MARRQRRRQQPIPPPSHRAFGGDKGVRQNWCVRVCVVCSRCVACGGATWRGGGWGPQALEVDVSISGSTPIAQGLLDGGVRASIYGVCEANKRRRRWGGGGFCCAPRPLLHARVLGISVAGGMQRESQWVSAEGPGGAEGSGRERRADSIGAHGERVGSAAVLKLALMGEGGYLRARQGGPCSGDAEAPRTVGREGG